MAKTDSERLAVVETKLDILTEEIKKIGKGQSELMASLPTYVTLAQHNKAIETLNRKRWVQNTLSAIFGAVLSLLVGYFITHIGG